VRLLWEGASGGLKPWGGNHLRAFLGKTLSQAPFEKTKKASRSSMVRDNI